MNTHLQVRDAARELTVSVYEVIGKRVLPYIEPVLRKKQMDEYGEAFRRTTAGAGKSESFILPLLYQLHIICRNIFLLTSRCADLWK